MLLKIGRPRQRRVAVGVLDRNKPVILSGVIASLREAITESKDPYFCTDVSGGICRGRGRSVRKPARNWFATRTGCSAQDDKNFRCAQDDKNLVALSTIA